MECVMPISDLADICTPTMRPRENERSVRLNPRREHTGEDDAKGKWIWREKSASALTGSEIESQRQRDSNRMFVHVRTVSCALHVGGQRSWLRLRSVIEASERSAAELRPPPPHLMTNRGSAGGRAGERARSFRSFVRFLPAANQFHAELRSGGGGGDDDRIVFIAIATAERGRQRRERGLSRKRPAPPSLLASVTESDLNN